MAIELFNQNGHVCLMFSHLSDEGGEAVQANQFLIVHNDHGCVIDPGGNMAFNELLLTIGRYFPPQKLDKILASHADPDIIASLDRWMTSTQAQLYISKLWERFVPHFCKPGKTHRPHRGHSRCRHAHPVGATWWRCRRTSCTRKATSSSGTPSAASCSRVTWACR
jgi:flavorubredoxin